MFRSLKPRWRLRQHEIWLFWRIFLYGKMKSSSYFLCYELMNLDSHWIPAMINDGVLLVKAIASNIFDSPAIRHGATGACAVRYIYIYTWTLRGPLFFALLLWDWYFKTFSIKRDQNSKNAFLGFPIICFQATLPIPTGYLAQWFFQTSSTNPCGS